MNGKYLYVAVAALGGVLCSLTGFLPLFLLVIGYFFSIFHYKKFTGKQFFFLVSVFIILALSTQLHLMKNNSKIPSSQTVFYLQFTDNPTINGDQYQVSGKEKNGQEKLLVRYQIQSEVEKELLQTQTVYKRLCIVTGVLEKPKVAKNENEFNYRKYLSRKHVYWVLKTNESPLSTCVDDQADLLVLLKEFRFHGITYLDKNFPTEIAAIASALIYGDRSGISPDLLENYQKIGIIHLLAISGLHVSLFIASLYFIGIRAGIARERMNRFILLMLPGYAVLTGGSPSVVRSVLMIFLVMISIQLKNKVKLVPIDAISIAFSAYLLVEPLVLYDVGFQLSFSVSAAILLSSSLILRRYRNSLLRMTATSMIAQLAAYPILLFHFYEVSFVSVAANLIFIPLYSFVFLPGVYLLLIIRLMVGAIPNWILFFFSDLLKRSDQLAKFIANHDILHYTPGRPHFIILCLYAVLVLVIFIYWEKSQSKRDRRILLSLCILLVTFQIVVKELNPVGEVTMIDVGQGDSILIHLPFNQGNYLIDTGGTMNFNEADWQKPQKEFEVGSDIVVPYLKSKGITKLDMLILTHGDMDHIGGAESILNELDVKEIIIPSVSELANSEIAIIQTATLKRIPVVKAAEGDRWSNHQNKFQVLSPERNFTGERNRGSLTIWAEIGGLRWFFGGDLDQAGEEEISKRMPNLMIDVLKVGHHGSKTSSSPVFLKQYQPKISLISVGEKNHFGHPNSQVIERLEEINSGIYRTDRQGAITYRYFENKGTFSTYLP